MTSDPIAGAGAKHKVVVIDDDPAVRDSLRMLLSTRFDEVREFDSAEAFLADGARDGRTCLVVDVNLPGIDGLDLVERLDAENGGVRAVLISGRYDEAMRRRAARLGVAALLEKPVEFEDLLGAIARAMR